MEETIYKLLPRVLEWKKRYGTIYYLKISERFYVFRTLSISEHATLLGFSAIVDADLSDELLKLCLLYPEYDEEKLDCELAGTVDSIILAIKRGSGFSEKDDIIEDIGKSRGLMDTLENQISILICKAFPHLTLEDIDKLTYAEIIRYIALSEAILDVKLNIEKPDSTKDGTVDFDMENKSLNEPPPFRKKNKHRGAPDK